MTNPLPLPQFLKQDQKSSRWFDRIKKKMYMPTEWRVVRVLSYSVIYCETVTFYSIRSLQYRTQLNTTYTASRPINMSATMYWASYTLDLYMTGPKLCWQLYGICILSLVLSPLLWRLTHGSVTVTQWNYIRKVLRTPLIICKMSQDAYFNSYRERVKVLICVGEVSLAATRMTREMVINKG